MTALSKQNTREGSQVGSQGNPGPAPKERPSTKQLQKTVAIVKVGTGPRQDQYVIHAELLCYYSLFFKKALTGNFEEAKTGLVQLHDDDPEVFDIFQNWLYKQDLGLDASQCVRFTLLLSLWVFGDKVQVPSFQDAAIEALRDRTINTPRIIRLKDVLYVYENTSHESPLRQFIVDLYVWEGAIGESIEKFFDEGYPHAFIISIVQGYYAEFHRPSAKTVKNNRPYAQNAEKYHMENRDPMAATLPPGNTVVTAFTPYGPDGSGNKLV
ncbi:MAG: hypothetical protein Q9202_002202 [Teloschistes flavicans]